MAYQTKTLSAPYRHETLKTIDYIKKIKTSLFDRKNKVKEGIVKNTRGFILKYREKLGVTQKEMAKKLGISYNTYINYEHGTRQAPIELCLKILRMNGDSHDLEIVRSIEEVYFANDENYISFRARYLTRFRKTYKKCENKQQRDELKKSLFNTHNISESQKKEFWEDVIKGDEK